MAQASWPLVGVNFSDLDWRDSFGAEAGVTGDFNGSAYKVTLAPDSDVATIGSTTQKSTAQVAGFGHRIPAGQPEPITIPVASGSARTDIIALRYDPAFTGAPGPVRLVRIPGTSAGLPAYDDAPPGIEDLPLWAVTRQPGQALSQAAVQRLFPRITVALDVPASAPLPTNVPLGSTVRYANQEWRRELGSSSGVPEWRSTAVATSTAPVDIVLNSVANGAGFANFGNGLKNACYWREGRTGYVVGTLRMAGTVVGLASRGVTTTVPLPVGFRPNGIVTAPTDFGGRFEILPTGHINLVNGSLVTIPNNSLLSMNFAFPIA